MLTTNGPMLDRLDDLAGQPGVSADHLQLERALAVWRHHARQALEGLTPVEIPGEAVLLQAVQEESCLARHVDPQPAQEVLAETAAGLVEALQPVLPAAAPALDRWLRARVGPHADPEALAAWFAAGWRIPRNETNVPLSSPAVRDGVDEFLFVWSGRQLASPFFHRLAELLTVVPADRLPPRPTCPCCGGEPQMSRLEREEGRRYLWCDLCDLQWTYRRIACPYCGNTAHERLGYLEVEGIAGYRIDVCEACRRYLRVIQERGQPEGRRTDFVAEQVATLQLCMAAERQGYRPGGLDAIVGDLNRGGDSV